MSSRHTESMSPEADGPDDVSAPTCLCDQVFIMHMEWQTQKTQHDNLGTGDAHMPNKPGRKKNPK